jgi:hypothetical protein
MGRVWTFRDERAWSMPPIIGASARRIGVIAAATAKARMKATRNVSMRRPSARS